MCKNSSVDLENSLLSQGIAFLSCQPAIVIHNELQHGQQPKMSEESKAEVVEAKQKV